MGTGRIRNNKQKKTKIRKEFSEKIGITASDLFRFLLLFLDRPDFDSVEALSEMRKISKNDKIIKKCFDYFCIIGIIEMSKTLLDIEEDDRDECNS